MDLGTAQIAGTVITELAKDAAKSILEKISKYLDDETAKSDIDYGDAFENYLKISAEKNSKIKTLIYRHEPKELSKIYECIGVSYGEKNINTNSVNNLLEIGHKIIITGTGGIGKTTLLKHLFLSTIRETRYIPILVELRSINNSEGDTILLEDLIYQSLCNYGLEMKREHFEYSLEAGRYLILLDGYDEVNREKVADISKQIQEIGTKYPQNYYIISSRPTDEFMGWNDFYELKSNLMTKSQAISMVKKLEFESSVKDLFCKELDRELYDKYRSFASNPLLLTIMLLTFDNRASIPDKLNDFYEQAFSTLYNIHDATKGSFKRDIRTGLGCEDFKLIFAYFCFKTYFSMEFEFNEPQLRKYINQAREKFDTINFRVDDFQEDLVQSVCMLVKDGLTYMFSHRSFQEYFAAWYTTKLTDDVQVKLINSWLMEKKGFASDAYFSMLYDLQSNKFDKLILNSGLKKVKKEYEKEGFSFAFVSRLCDGLSIRPLNKNISESLRIKDNYLCSIIKMTCMFHKYVYKDKEKSDEKFVRYVKHKLGDRHRRVIQFDEIEKDNMTEYLLEEISWFKDQIEFCLRYLEKITKENSVRHVRKVSSIIDNL